MNNNIDLTEDRDFDNKSKSLSWIPPYDSNLHRIPWEKSKKKFKYWMDTDFNEEHNSYNIFQDKYITIEDHDVSITYNVSDIFNDEITTTDFSASFTFNNVKFDLNDFKKYRTTYSNSNNDSKIDIFGYKCPIKKSIPRIPPSFIKNIYDSKLYIDHFIPWKKLKFIYNDTHIIPWKKKKRFVPSKYIWNNVNGHHSIPWDTENATWQQELFELLVQ